MPRILIDVYHSLLQKVMATIRRQKMTQKTGTLGHKKMVYYEYDEKGWVSE